MGTTLPTAFATGGIDMGEPVIYSLTELIKRFELEQSDAEWTGDLRLATRCKQIATRYRERLEEGEDWEPSF